MLTMDDDVRYVLHPGVVPSAYDGQRHYIGVGMLRSLYLIPPNARVIVRPDYDHVLDRHIFDALYQEQPGDIHCSPMWRHTDYPRFQREADGS